MAVWQNRNVCVNVWRNMRVYYCMECVHGCMGEWECVYSHLGEQVCV